MTRILAFALALAVFAPAPRAADSSETPMPRTPDVPYVPTPPEVVQEMLRQANLQPDDVLYDLGCGDGRIVIAAAKQGVKKAVGIDIDPERIAEAKKNAKDAGVADKVEFRQQDLFEADFGDATVLTLYLLPAVNQKLRPRIERLRPGTRVVSHAFDMGDWKPEKKVDVDGRTVYRWTVGGKDANRRQARTPGAQQPAQQETR